MVSAKAIELIAHAIETSKDSYDKIAAATTISKTTLCRLVKQHTASRYTLDILASYFGIGEQYQALVGNTEYSCAYASELAEELRNTRAFYEEKAVSVRQHYEEQLAALRDLNSRQEREHEREREQQQRNHDSSVNYLKAEIERLRAERDEARNNASSASKASDELTSKKHIVFWSLGVLAALEGLALIILLLIYLLR